MPSIKNIKNFGQYKKELLSVLTRIKSPKLLEDFLADLLSPQEMAEVVTRLHLVKMLRNGVLQRDVAKRLNISIAKVTRGSRVLLNKSGGFNRVFKLLKVK